MSIVQGGLLGIYQRGSDTSRTERTVRGGVFEHERTPVCARDEQQEPQHRIIRTSGIYVPNVRFSYCRIYIKENHVPSVHCSVFTNTPACT